MKTLPSRQAPVDARDPSAPQPQRRRLVVGAGVAAGAAVAAAAALRPNGEAPTSAAKAAADSTAPGGYRLTDHIRRYYDTTRS